MKRFMGKVVVGVATTVALTTANGLASVSFADVNPPATQGTLVALGDSITFGYNLSDTENNSIPSQDAFPYLIGQKDHLNVTDLGIPGWTSGDLLNAMHSANFIRAIHGASAITLDIGSNDLLRWAAVNGFLSDAAGSTPPTLTTAQEEQVAGILTQFGKNYAEIIGGIRLLTHAPIVAYNLYNPFPTQSPLHSITEQFQAVENQEIVAIAAVNQQVVVANAHAAFNNHQLTYVRVLEGDVHPTILGQSVLATIGEKALAPLQREEPRPNFFSGVTDLLAGGIAQSGGSITGTVNGSQVNLTIPAGSLNQGTEVDVTSQQAEQQNLHVFNFSLPFAKFITEDAVNFMANTSFQKPYTLTIHNPNITNHSLVFALTGTSIQPVSSANISAGQVTVSATQGEDFVVISFPFSFY